MSKLNELSWGGGCGWCLSPGVIGNAGQVAGLVHGNTEQTIMRSCSQS